MASAVPLPVQDYLDGSFDSETEVEYVDGEIENRPVGEYDHAIWQDALLAWFTPRGDEWGI